MDSTASSANPCSVGTAALALPKSRLLRVGPVGRQWNKEALSQPHPRVEPVYLGRT